MLGIVIVTCIALVFGIVLVFIDDLKDQNEELERLISLLPGLNCGVCGFGNCRGMAEAILKEKDSYKKCRPLRGEKKELLENYIEKEKI